MMELIDQRDAEADDIIRRHVNVSMAGGALPVPLADLAAVSVVHVRMLRELAECYGVTHDAGSARAFVTSVSGALAGMTAGRVAASLLKLLPGVGWTAGGLTQMLVTGASTFVLGTLVKRLFRENRPLSELELSTVREELESYFASQDPLLRALRDLTAGAAATGAGILSLLWRKLDGASPDPRDRGAVDEPAEPSSTDDAPKDTGLKPAP